MPSSRPFLVDLPRVAREGPEATPLTSHASLFWLPPLADSQTRCPLEISQPCGLKNDLLCSRPLRAYSHLEHRDVSRSGRAHCVRWVARLYQKPSLSCHRWVMTGQDDWTSRSLHSPLSLCEIGQFDWTSRSLHSPVTLDRPGRLDFVKTAGSLHWKGRPAFF